MTSPARETDAPATADVVTQGPSLLARIGQLLILVSGAVLLISGAVALARTGVHSDLSTPVVEVLGYSHTPWLGIAELIAGLLLIAGGASAGRRELGLVVGVVLLVAGFLLSSDATLAPKELAVEEGYGLLLVLVGAAAVVGGLLPGGWVTRRTQRTRRI